MSSSTAPDAPARPRPSSPLSRLRRVPFGAQVIAGLVLGVALGLVARTFGGVDESGVPVNWLVTTLDTVGSTFVTLLVALVPPLVLLAVITSIANLRQVAGAARLAGQTLLWFAITAAVSVAIGLTIGLVTDPGTRSGVSADAARDPSRTSACTSPLLGSNTRPVRPPAGASSARATTWSMKRIGSLSSQARRLLAVCL